MIELPANNNEFAVRLVKLAEDFDKYDFIDNDGEDNEVLENTIKNIESDIIKHNTSWIKEWLENAKDELNGKINSEDPDYIGSYLVECDRLLDYLDNI